MSPVAGFRRASVEIKGGDHGALIPYQGLVVCVVFPSASSLLFARLEMTDASYVTWTDPSETQPKNIQAPSRRAAPATS